MCVCGCGRCVCARHGARGGGLDGVYGGGAGLAWPRTRILSPPPRSKIQLAQRAKIQDPPLWESSRSKIQLVRRTQDPRSTREGLKLLNPHFCQARCARAHTHEPAHRVERSIGSTREFQLRVRNCRLSTRQPMDGSDGSTRDAQVFLRFVFTSSTPTL